MYRTNTQVMDLLSEDIHQMVSILENGGIVLYPTDTIWGIGCDAFNEKAINQIYTIKNRPRHKPLIVLVSDLSMLRQYVSGLHPRIETLLSFHTRPLTIIYEQGIELPQFLKAPDGSIGIRVVQDAYCQQVIKALNRPIVSTSANFSQEAPPACFNEISGELIKLMDFTSTHRRSDQKRHEPSVVVKYDEEGNLEFLRT